MIELGLVGDQELFEPVDQPHSRRAAAAAEPAEQLRRDFDRGPLRQSGPVGPGPIAGQLKQCDPGGRLDAVQDRLFQLRGGPLRQGHLKGLLQPGQVGLGARQMLTCGLERSIGALAPGQLGQLVLDD